MLVTIKIPDRTKNFLNKVLLSEEGQKKASICELQFVCTCVEVSDDEDKLIYEAARMQYIIQAHDGE